MEVGKLPSSVYNMISGRESSEEKGDFGANRSLPESFQACFQGTDCFDHLNQSKLRHGNFIFQAAVIQGSSPDPHKTSKLTREACVTTPS